MRAPVLVLVLVLVLVATGRALADVKPGEKKEEKAPDAQGTGTEMPKGPLDKMKNPLPAIVEQMAAIASATAASVISRTGIFMLCPLSDVCLKWSGPKTKKPGTFRASSSKISNPRYSFSHTRARKPSAAASTEP